MIQQSQLQQMSQISFVNDYSINPYNNAEMKRKYLRHKNKIDEINKKTSPYSHIEQQQKRIIQVVHKSKELSRKFQIQQFQLRKSIQNKRMINHLSRFQNRKHSTLQQAEQILINKKYKANTKQEIMRQFQINLENKSMSEHLQEFTVNKKKYRKKVQQEVLQYQKLKYHMQKFKKSNSSISRMQNRRNKDISSRNMKSRNNIEAPFFKDDKMTLNDNVMNKSRSLPPLQLMMV